MSFFVFDDAKVRRFSIRCIVLMAILAKNGLIIDANQQAVLAHKHSVVLALLFSGAKILHFRPFFLFLQQSFRISENKCG